MKKFLLILIMVTVLVLSACAAAQTTVSEAPDTKASTEVPVSTAPANTSGTAGEISYSKDVMPLFLGYCAECHGNERVSRGLDMRTYESTMKGSQNGPVVIPGDSAGSALARSIVSGKMPKRGNKFTQEQIDLILKWIDQGAKNN